MGKRKRFHEPTEHVACDSVEALARALSIAPSTLGKWKREGAEFQREDGKFCSRLLFAWLKEREDEDEDDPGKRLLTAKADREALKLRRERGELMLVEDVREALHGLCAIVRTSLQTLPARMANRLAGQPAATIEQELDKELRELMKQAQKQAGALQIRGPADAVR